MTDQLFVSFPDQAWWIPDTERFGDSGQVILDICGAVLDQWDGEDGQSRGLPYQRRVLTTGQIVPLVPDQDGQLVVSCFEMALGRAGEQRFQFFKGTMGTYAQRFIRYQVTMARKSPVVTGGIAPRMQRADDLVDFARLLWTDAYIVWSALLATALGGVRNAQTGEQLSPAPITQDNLLIGPVSLDPPQGGLAVAKIEVIIQE